MTLKGISYCISGSLIKRLIDGSSSDGMVVGEFHDSEVGKT